MAAPPTDPTRPMTTHAKTLAAAVRHHQSGELSRAEDLYREILSRDPGHVDALHLLGLIAHQIGKNDIAAKYITHALRLKPSFAEAHNNLGNVLRDQGKVDEAVASYQKAIRLKPSYADAHSNLGNAYRAQGKPDMAIACYEKALRLKPNFAEAHNNLGIVHMDQGRLDRAVAYFEKALKRRPDFAEAHNNFGSALKELGRPEEAIARYREALRLKPTYAEAYSSLGNALMSLGRRDEATEAYRQAVRAKPDFAEAYNNLGIALLHQGKTGEAEAAYREALRHKPEYPDALNNLANLLKDRGQLAEAVGMYREALRLRPAYAEAHNNLGIALLEQGHPDDALANYREALRLRPNYPDALNNLGNLLKDRDQLAEAEASYREALRLRPDYAEAYHNLGIILMDSGRLDEAEACYRQAIRIWPDYAEAHKSLSFAYLLKGDLERGWPEYEWRWKCKGFGMPPFSQPLWDGLPLEGRTLLIHSEQGLGDVLQFIRYAGVAKKTGGRVVAAVPKPLVKLLARSPGIDEVRAQGDWPSFDVHAPVMSLPFLVKTTMASIPADVPYVLPQPELVEQWRRELGTLRAFKIGIVWQGNKDYKGDRFRSIPLRQFARLAEVEGVHFFSLQKGYGTEQLPEVAGRMPVTDLNSRLDVAAGPFMDTAAVMKVVDLVITSDTSVCHLAGALGVPVWLALSTVHDWRWLQDREDCPWYPTMRLFRQRQRGNWDDVFERMKEALRERVAMKPASKPILVEVAPGELIDKITILQIKDRRITDPAKLANVRLELATLQAAWERAVASPARLEAVVAELRLVNEALWDVEDEIRVCEKNKDFGPRFIELARSVYRQNDRRAALKRQVNELLGSQIIEEKAYQSY